MSTETEVENKAKMLISLFFQGSHMVAKRFALIAVDEVLNCYNESPKIMDECVTEFYEKVREKIKTL